MSRYASEALDRKKRVLAVLDFFPSLKDEELFSLLKEQRMYLSDRKAEGFLNGIFHKKLAALFLKASGIRGEEMAGRLSDKKAPGGGGTYKAHRGGGDGGQFLR